MTTQQDEKKRVLPHDENDDSISKDEDDNNKRPKITQVDDNDDNDKQSSSIPNTTTVAEEVIVGDDDDNNNKDTIASNSEEVVVEEDPISKWGTAWDSILQRGESRWIITDLEIKQKALNYITKYVVMTRTKTKTTNDTNTTSEESPSSSSSLQIICPLAGNDKFVHYAWSQGHSVTAIDLVPQAITAMKENFGKDEKDWSKMEYCMKEKDSKKKEEKEEEKEDTDNNKNGGSGGSGIVCYWTHKSGRVTLYQGDITTPITEIHGTFDAIYDKDSFGAIPPTIRSEFCQRMGEYLKDDGILYSEVKFKMNDHPNRYGGPPYHIVKDDYMKLENFGSTFEYVDDLGEVYDFQSPQLKQTGHVLKKKKK